QERARNRPALVAKRPPPRLQHLFTQLERLGFEPPLGIVGGGELEDLIFYFLHSRSADRLRDARAGRPVIGPGLLDPERQGSVDQDPGGLGLWTVSREQSIERDDIRCAGSNDGVLAVER